MTPPILRAKASLFVVACTLIAGCSFQVPSEGDVFEKNSAGGQTAGGNTNTSLGGSNVSTSTGGNAAQVGGTSSSVPGSSSGGAGGTAVNSSGGAAGTDTNAGASSVGGAGGATASGGAGVSGGSTSGPAGGANTTVGGSMSSGGNSPGGASATGGSIAVGGASTATGGTVPTTVGGSGPVTGGSPGSGGSQSAGTSATGGVATGGAAAGGTATGGAATGGAATGGAATGGTATGGAATGGAATGGAPTGGAPTGGAPPQVILQYKFEEGSGTTAVDSTPSHNDGTLSNVTWSLTGRNGRGVNYAAVDSQIAMPSTLLGTSQSLTVSAWVNLTTNTAENRLFYFGTADGTSYFTLTFNNGTSGTSVRFKSPTGTEQVLTTPTQIPTGVWKHITVSVSNMGAALYVDGKIVKQDMALVMDPTTLGTPMTNLVGASPTAGQNFQGVIDEFYVYNGVLPLTDIRVLAAPKTDYSMYHMDEGTGTATHDSSTRGTGGSGINGKLVGDATWVPSPFGTGVLLANASTATPAQQFVDLDDGIVSDCTVNLTLAGWVKFTSNATEAPLLEFAKDTANLVNITTFAAGAYNQAVFSFELANNTTTQPRIVRQRPYPGGSTPAGAGWVMEKWTHIAVVRSGALGTVDAGKLIGLFQDGVRVASGNLGTGAQLNVWGSTTLNALGKSSNDTVPGFDGAIDEVLVSCRDYTDDEIKQLAYLPPN